MSLLDIEAAKNKGRMGEDGRYDVKGKTFKAGRESDLDSEVWVLR